MLEVVCIARWNSLMTSWIVFFITENSSVVVAFVCIPFCGFGRVGCQVQTQIIFLSSSRKMMLSWRTQFRQQHGASYSPSRTAFLSQRSLGWKVGSRWQHQHSANPMTAGMRKKRGNHSNSHSDYILTMNCSVWRWWTGETWRCLPLLSQTPLPLPVPLPVTPAPHDSNVVWWCSIMAALGSYGGGDGDVGRQSVKQEWHPPHWGRRQCVPPLLFDFVCSTLYWFIFYVNSLQSIFCSCYFLIVLLNKKTVVSAPVIGVT